MPPTAAPAGDATREFVVGGTYNGFTPSGGYLVAAAIDDVVRQYGAWVYELMRLDPAISGSLNLLFAGILAEGPRVVSPLTADPGEQTMSRRRKRELRLAEQITEFWQQQIETVQPSFDQTLWEMYDEATLRGCTLVEPVYRLEESGPYRGKYVLDTFQVKAHGAWGMLADPYLRVRKVRCLTTAGWKDVDRSHFVMMSWQPRCGDPRGTRLLRPCYPSWNIKLQAHPDYAEYLKHHADPKLVLTAGENAMDSEEVDATTGTRTTMTPQERLLAAGQKFSNRSVLALMYGDTAELLYSQGNGEAYLKGFDWADREMFRTIIIGARGMQEAKNSSKADTGTAMDLIGMAVTQSRKPGIEAIRNDLFYRGTLLNWGKDVADRFTPGLAFGISDHLSPTIMQALALAWKYGVLQAPQRPWMLAKIGAPQDPAPDPDASDQQGDGQGADQQGQQSQGDGSGDAPPKDKAPGE